MTAPLLAQVVEWMMRSDIKPNVRTYTALITALGNARQWDRALDIVARMKRHGYGAGIEPNAYTYSGEENPHALEENRVWDGWPGIMFFTGETLKSDVLCVL